MWPGLVVWYIVRLTTVWPRTLNWTWLCSMILDQLAKPTFCNRVKAWLTQWPKQCSVTWAAQSDTVSGLVTYRVNWLRCASWPQVCVTWAKRCNVNQVLWPWSSCMTAMLNMIVTHLPGCSMLLRLLCVSLLTQYMYDHVCSVIMAMALRCDEGCVVRPRSMWPWLCSAAKVRVTWVV